LKKNTERSFNREDWLQLALKVLIRDGVERVRVEPLAKELGVTKGSFYWHFKNRDDLLSQILSYWSDEMTAQVFHKITKMEVSPKDKMFALMEEVVIKKRGKYDSAIRSWAKQSKAVALAVGKIDHLRLEFLSKLFTEIGFSKSQAQIRAQLMYGYMVGEPSIVSHVSRAEHLSTMRTMIDVVAQAS